MPDLYTKLAKLGANLLEELFKNLLELLQSARPQNEENITYGKFIKWIIAFFESIADINLLFF